MIIVSIINIMLQLEVQPGLNTMHVHVHNYLNVLITVPLPQFLCDHIQSYTM